jgi:DegV family protein with EDD domain
MNEYVILTDAAADHAETFINRYPGFEIIPMEVTVNRKQYIYGGPQSEIMCKTFYELQRGGCHISTVLISPETYIHYFSKYAEKNTDIIYLSFSSGMSGTFQSANLAASEIRESYSDIRITCIDSLNAATAQGFLVHEALKQKEAGLTYDEMIQWIEDRRLRVGAYFAVDTMEYLVKGGRISPAAASVGTALHIRPVLTINELGKLQVVTRQRGMRQAMKVLVQIMSNTYVPEDSSYTLICHADAPEYAEELKNMVCEKFPGAEIEIGEIDPIIGAHTGPGMISLVFWAESRKKDTFA